MEANVIELLRKAAKDLNTVVITYQDSTGQISDRETEPYEIKDGKYWGFSLDRGQIRQFTIGRIMNAYITSNKYRPRWAVKIY
jgi:predicted DNA-binding transcriptional regulator YafY